MDAMWGEGFATVSVADCETPPPGAGLLTVTLASPAVESAVFGIVARSSDADVNGVLKVVPPSRSGDAGVNPVPCTVNCVAVVPTVSTSGEITATLGAGFVIATVAELARVGNVELATLIVTGAAGATAGAVYIPSRVITPTSSLPPGMPL